MRTLAILTLAILVAAPGFAGDRVDRDAVSEILQRYVEDYRQDPTVPEVGFGVEVGGEWWSVRARPAEGDVPARVTLSDGAPPDPTFYFTLNHETLLKLDRGELNAETAMVKEFSTDPSPMDIEVMEGFEPGPDFIGLALPTTFHFWTRGLPEFIPFGESHTRPTHGADAVVFYYQPGFRSGWGSLKKGQHANKDPRSRTNPFPSLLVFTKGVGKARIGGKEVEVTAGKALLIPAGISHEFWNDNDEPVEFILLMFGEGA